jgi:hypothetical protein
MASPAYLPNTLLCYLALMAVCPTLAVAESAAYSEADVHRARTDEPMAFDIPMQPLAAAIETYAVATGLQILYNAHLVAGRPSTALVGVLTPQAALRLLLKGSGLVVRYAAPGALVIVAPPAGSSARSATPSAIGEVALRGTNAEQRRYYGLIQVAIRNAFCANAATRSGRYRAAVSFRIDQAGAVQRFELLGSTGDGFLDEAINDAMHHVAVGESPPSTMPQPFTTIIVPQSSDAGVDCR